jgi:hypothetical protein
MLLVANESAFVELAVNVTGANVTVAVLPVILSASESVASVADVLSFAVKPL